MPEPVVALLRAVNLGAHNRVPMTPLRELFGDLGHPEARTYVQSGNVVFVADVGSATKRSDLVATIQAAISRRFGVTEPVILRTRTELASLPARNPYVPGQDDQTKVHVVFLAGPPDPERVAKMKPAPPDECTVDGTEIFVHYPNGAGRTKLRLEVGVPGTARNWRTVLALLEMM